VISLFFVNLSARFAQRLLHRSPNMSSNQRIITDNNKSPLIQVLSLMFLVIAILSCFVRTGAKLYMIKALRVDDILIIVATVRHLISFVSYSSLCLCFFAQVLAACQTVIVFNACEHGLGQHFEVLSSSDRETFFKVTPDGKYDVTNN
jgi:hypothetical protein